MKQIIQLFLCFMISLAQAGEDPLLQEDGTHASHQESRQLKATGILGNLGKDEYPEVLVAASKYPYIDPKCCNFSTTTGCSRLGSDGFRGRCMPRNETCLGREFYGTKYCIISQHQSCKCCVPTDCSKQALSPCTKLNGTCIGINDHCNGTSVVSDEFCRRDSKNDTCKCCFPLMTPEDCPCGQDHNGICVGIYPKGHGSGGKEARGRCMKTCDSGHTSLTDHTCNKTGGKDCKCCDLYNYCGKACESSNIDTMSCVCTTNGNACPGGYCSHPNTDFCPEGSCSCCKPIPQDCTSRLDQCSAPKDKCVEKLRVDCPKGFSKVIDACSKGEKSKDRADKEGAVSKDRFKEAEYCDCCKSLECSSIGDLCTGRGSFCIDYHSNCPFGYTESLDCSKPVITNGTIFTMSRCKCCKPGIYIECPKGCFRVGSQCFLKTIYSTYNWNEAAGICKKYGKSLAEPQDPQALSQYLATNYDDGSYWIGAHGTTNDNAAWVSGGVIGPNAPWFGNWYNSCDRPKLCMYLLANSGCYASNQCLGCWVCNGNNLAKRTPLCSCTIRS